MTPQAKVIFDTEHICRNRSKTEFYESHNLIKMSFVENIFLY